MEDGQLNATYLEDYTEKITDENGNTTERIVTAEEQAARLSPEWKPVDYVSGDRLNEAGEGEVIVPQPYDAGDHIAYRYIRKFDTQKVRREIEYLKAALAESDYKITKCYEASMLGAELPYDIKKLHEERQAQRDQINALEEKMVEFESQE